MPAVIGFNDYHDIEAFSEQLENIIPSIKHRELGMADREYKAIFFVRKNPDYKRLVKQTEAYIEQWHEVMKIRRIPRWLEAHVYDSLIRGCTAKTISISKKDTGITGGSPDIIPIHSYDAEYVSLEEFLDNLQNGVDYELDEDCEWVHDFWA